MILKFKNIIHGNYQAGKNKDSKKSHIWVIIFNIVIHQKDLIY
jgi:hypothetical protein